MRPSANAVLSAMPASDLVLEFAIILQQLGALTFEKVNRLVSDQVARQILRCVHTAHNQRAVAIGTFPQFNETGLLNALLKLDCATHHCDCVSGVFVCTGASKASDRLLCFSKTALSYEPPGRLRRKEH